MGQIEVEDSLKAISEGKVKLRYFISSTGTIGFLNVSGTLPTTPANAINGIRVEITSAGSASQQQYGSVLILRSGYTGPFGTFGSASFGQSAGTGTTPFNEGGNAANYGVFGQATSVTTGINIGTYGEAHGGSTNYGLFGDCRFDALADTNIGVAGFARTQGGSIQVGGYFSLKHTNSNPTYENAALIADNDDYTDPILICRDNGSSVFKIDNGGDIQVNRTITAGGTTGAQTINKAAGTVNFAAAATSLVITNSLVTANSIILCTIRTNDATLTSVQCVPTAGSFTIFANAPATAETSVGFLVLN